ncbi:MAG: hypothetical protein ACP5SH_25055, partial [Syntrophobacteraceae bacterium]
PFSFGGDFSKKTIWVYALERRFKERFLNSAALPLLPAYDNLIDYAAREETIHNDDTTMKVLAFPRLCLPTLHLAAPGITFPTRPWNG